MLDYYYLWRKQAQMQKVKHIPHYTYEDYKSWKGDWELVDGVPFAMSPSAMGKHQFVAVNLVKQIGNQLDEKPCKNNCFVYYELDWIIDKSNIVRPDISVVCGVKVTGFIEQPPVLVVEILSQSTAYNDRIVKKDIYEANGVKYYLIADPEKQTVVVFELTGGAYQEKEISTFELNDNCGLKLDFDSIWE